MKIVFFGTSEFGIASLEALFASGHSISAIITLPPKPHGRGRTLVPTPIARYVRQKKNVLLIETQQLNDLCLCQQLEGLYADVFVVIAFRLLPACVFSIPPFGTLNVHASLLPRYRGPAPIQRAIEAGEMQTGVTVFRIDAGIDTGYILGQRVTEIGFKETAPELSQRLSVMGAELLVQILHDLGQGNVIGRPQEEACATLAPKLRKEEGRIDWWLPAEVIYNRIRAFKPFPGVYTSFMGKTITIEWAVPLNEQSSLPPGTVTKILTEGFEVACGQGTLQILSVKPENKRIMSAADFYRGYHLQAGMLLQ